MVKTAPARAKPKRMTRTTETQVRLTVERAVEGVLDRWATGNKKQDVERYITKLRLTASNLRDEAQAIDELADQEAQ